MTRSISFQFRVSPEEKERIRANAEQAGLTTSEYVRVKALAVDPEYLVHPPDHRQARWVRARSEYAAIVTFNDGDKPVGRWVIVPRIGPVLRISIEENA